MERVLLSATGVANVSCRVKIFTARESYASERRAGVVLLVSK